MQTEIFVKKTSKYLVKRKDKINTKDMLTDKNIFRKKFKKMQKFCLLSACGTMSLETAKKILVKSMIRQGASRPVQPRTTKNMIRQGASRPVNRNPRGP